MAKRILTKECENELKKANMTVNEFIRTNDFGGHCVRQSRKAIDMYNQLREKNILIWNR